MIKIGVRGNTDGFSSLPSSPPEVEKLKPGCPIISYWNKLIVIIETIKNVFFPPKFHLRLTEVFFFVGPDLQR